jgi:hypothetical protein
MGSKLESYFIPLSSTIIAFLISSNPQIKGTYALNAFIFLEVGFALWTLFGTRSLVLFRSIVSATSLLVLIFGTGVKGSSLAIHLAAISLILLSGYILAKKPDNHTKNRLIQYFSIFLILKIIVEMFSPNPNWFFVWVSIPAALISLSVQRISSLNIEAIKTSLLNLAVFESLIGIFEFLNSNLLFGEVQLGLSAHGFSFGSTRAQATLGHPLVLAILLGFAIFISIGAKSRPPTLKMIEITALTLGIYASGSSSVLISVLIGCLVLLIRSDAWRVKTGLIVAAGLASIGIGWSLVFSAASAILSDVSGQSALHRLTSLVSAPNLVLERDVFVAFFGSGQGSIDNIFSEGLIEDSLTHAIDNQFVHSLATMGLLGLIILLGVLGLSLIRSWRSGKAAFGTFVFIFLMFFSFDLLAWAVPAICVVLYLSSLPSSREDSVDSPDNSGGKVAGRVLA